MDLYRHDPEDADTESIRMARRLRKWYPAATLTDISRQIRRQRTIKQPCEIEAMREAVKITRDGILAMMKASKPGMYEYQYKAEFDYALAQHGCLAPAFPSIISGMKTSLALAFSGLVVAEMMGSDIGLGYIIVDSKNWFRVSDMFMAMFLIAAEYLVIYFLLSFLEKKLFKWKKTGISAVVENN